MLMVILVILGAWIGGVVGDEVGVAIGALVGWSLATHLRNNAHRKKLEARITLLEQTMGRLKPGSLLPLGGAGETPTNNPVTAPPPEPRTSAQPDTTPTVKTAAIPERQTAPDGAPHIATPSFEPRPPSATLATPAAPSFDPIAYVRDFLFGGNTVVRVGIIILLFGVGFLVKYAADNAYLPIEARLVGAVLLGIGLLVIGFRLRDKRLAYAVSLQGGGIGIVYVVAFAALKIYALIPASAALGIFVALGLATAFLSIVQDAIALAVLGIIGGFLAPILASTGSGDHVALFTYYALLNAGILGIAWFKAWRVLNLVGFTFTFIIGATWGVTSYAPENFESAQFFLALFFVFYAAIAVIYALRRPSADRGFIDTTLVFALPAVVFALEIGLVVHTPWGLAIASVVLAAFYVIVAALVYRVDPAHGRALAEAFAAIGLVFVTTAVPFALNASWTAAAYALEGAGLLWVGRRQKRPVAEVAGVLLQFCAGLTFDTPGSAELAQPVLAITYPYALLRAIGAVASAYFLRTRLSQVSRVAQLLLLLWAWGWVTGATIYDVTVHDLEASGIAILTSSLAIHALLLEGFGSRTEYAMARLGAMMLAPIALGVWVFAVVLIAWGEPMAWAWAGWGALAVAWLWIIRRNAVSEHPRMSAIAYGTTPVLLGVIAGLNAWVLISQAQSKGTWALSGALFASTLVLGVMLVCDNRNRWPSHPFARAVLIGCEPLLLALSLFCLWLTFTHDGNPRPLPYLPVLSPFDLAQLFVALAGIAWMWRLGVRHRDRYDVLVAPAGTLLALLLFFHLSAMCTRTVHHYYGVPYDFESLMQSNLVQTSLSITWSVLALVVTALASRKGWRVIWFVGGALLAVVVFKLFLVDLSSIATVARIVSFLVVGVLLLLIGWVSPVPPRTARAA